ncbi:unnamed protein product [Rotaria sordida]|uniref:Mutator-like transposase domain-containing protein n=1 Tax=Rotaria sordida TaxID=392033 RepID=A0A818W5D9_9BILA|nr:unnamed protein product [Rotaria sordida]
MNREIWMEDNSNVFIGAQNNNAAVRLNIKKLVKVIEKGKSSNDIKTRIVGGSTPPKGVRAWQEWEACGYTCFLGERSASDKNGLQCSICKTITDMTNFRMRPLYELQEPNQRLYAASAISVICYDVTGFILSLLGIKTPHRSNFYKQTHRLYDKLFAYVHNDFSLLINQIRRDKGYRPQEVMNLTISLDGTWKKRGHQSMYGIVFLIESNTVTKERQRRLADGKPYGYGVGRMTKAMEKKLANHYSLAIQQSSKLAQGTAIVT